MNAPAKIPSAFTVDPARPHIRTYADVEQGSDAWLAMRCGLLTASEMKLIVTPGTLKAASNDKERAHVAELAAQRITRYVEPHYVSDDMLRGQEDEIHATELYHKTYGRIELIGFITNHGHGFTLGYSPDGKIEGKRAGIENKSRRAKFQIDTICDLKVPAEHCIQLQTGLLVSEWEWIDYNSYCGGMPMVTLRVYPDAAVREAIVNAAGECERRIAARMERYADVLASDARLIPTERRESEEIVI